MCDTSYYCICICISKRTKNTFNFTNYYKLTQHFIFIAVTEALKSRMVTVIHIYFRVQIHNGMHPVKDVIGSGSLYYTILIIFILHLNLRFPILISMFYIFTVRLFVPCTHMLSYLLQQQYAQLYAIVLLVYAYPQQTHIAVSILYCRTLR